MGTDLWHALCALAVVVLPLAGAGWLVARQAAREKLARQARKARHEADAK